MNRQEYIEKLMQGNGYCECPDLAKLFEKRKAAMDLEARCNFFKHNADLEKPLPRDRAFIRDYQEEVRRLKSAVQTYYHSLYEHAAQDKVYFALHDATQEKVTEILHFERAQRLLREGEPIISIHCNRCEQQIDVASSTA